MSIQVMQRVWQSSPQKGSALLLLLAIADYCHDDGCGAYPAVNTLAMKVRMSPRNTQMLIKKLEAAGELEVTRGAGPGGCNLYRVKSYQGVKSDSPRGEKMRADGMKAASPRTVSKGRTVIEPSDVVSEKTPRPSRSGSLQCDDGYLEELQARPAYEMLNVRFVYSKMVTWCEVKGKQPMRARLVNWLNHEERPMTARSENGGMRYADKSERNGQRAVESFELLR